MKITIIFSAILLFYACGNQQVKNNKNTESKPIQLITILNESIDKNPNWNQNEILRKNFNDSIQMELSEKMNELQLLKEIPLKLSEINEYEKGKYAANFEHFIETKEYKIGNRNYDLNFNVIGLIPDSLINVLQDNKKYFLDGKFLRFLGWDFRDYIKGSVYTPMVGIEEEYGNIKVSIGIILFDVISIQESN